MNPMMKEMMVKKNSLMKEIMSPLTTSMTATIVPEKTTLILIRWKLISHNRIMSVIAKKTYIHTIRSIRVFS